MTRGGEAPNTPPKRAVLKREASTTTRQVKVSDRPQDEPKPLTLYSATRDRASGSGERMLVPKTLVSKGGAKEGSRRSAQSPSDCPSRSPCRTVEEQEAPAPEGVPFLCLECGSKKHFRGFRLDCPRLIGTLGVSYCCGSRERSISGIGARC